MVFAIWGRRRALVKEDGLEQIVQCGKERVRTIVQTPGMLPSLGAEPVTATLASVRATRVSLGRTVVGRPAL